MTNLGLTQNYAVIFPSSHSFIPLPHPLLPLFPLTFIFFADFLLSVLTPLIGNYCEGRQWLYKMWRYKCIINLKFLKLYLVVSPEISRKIQFFFIFNLPQIKRRRDRRRKDCTILDWLKLFCENLEWPQSWIRLTNLSNPNNW